MTTLRPLVRGFEGILSEYSSIPGLLALKVDRFAHSLRSLAEGARFQHRRKLRIKSHFPKNAGNFSFLGLKFISCHSGFPSRIVDVEKSGCFIQRPWVQEFQITTVTLVTKRVFARIIAAMWLLGRVIDGIAHFLGSCLERAHSVVGRKVGVGRHFPELISEFLLLSREFVGRHVSY